MENNNTLSNMGQKIPNILYHYTSYEKLKCLMKYGTLRFKLSTQSNDMLDTKHLINLVKRIVVRDRDKNDTKSQFIDFILGFYKRVKYESTYKSFVSCFTTIADSRLLWDAYTVNRPPNHKCEYGKDKFCYIKADSPRYNGVCIAIKTAELIKVLNNAKMSEVCREAYLAPIFYSEQQHLIALDFLINQAWEIFDKLKDDPDQNQTIVPEIPFLYSFDFGGYKTKPRGEIIKLKKCFVEAVGHFIYSVEAISPFIKYEFWKEEQEFRASLCRHKNAVDNQNFIKSDGISEYIDLDIEEDIIDHIILGPEFSQEDKKQLTDLSDSKIKFEKLKSIPSIGTGVIRMK